MVNKMDYLEDSNGLNEESIALAQYFYLTNGDIKRFKKKYEKLKLIKEAAFISCKSVIEGIKTQWLPLHNHIFQRYNNEEMDWNEFFQYVVYYSFAPMCSIIYTVLCIITESDGNKVSWNDVTQFAFVLRTSSRLKQDVNEYFRILDTNKDNFLSLPQFFTFVNKYYILFDPLFQFHLNLIQKYCFKTIIPILERKLNFRKIKSYKYAHNNKDPPEPCLYKIKRLLLDLPKSNHFDYEPDDPDRNLFSDINTEIIKHYKSNYKKSLKCNCNIKMVIQISKIDFLIKIDNYYLQYRSVRSRKSLMDNSLTPTTSGANNNNLSSDINKSGVSHSILRKSTYTFPNQLPTPNNKLSQNYKTSIFNNNNYSSEMSLGVNKRPPALSLKEVDLPGLLIPSIKLSSNNNVVMSGPALWNDMDEEKENNTNDGDNNRQNEEVEF